MGPQLVRCGMVPAGVRERIFLIASMGPQLVRCGMSVEHGRLSLEPALQWGRNLFVAECVQAVADPLDPRHASMGPQLVRCGMQFPYRKPHVRITSFNGAATCSLRNAERLTLRCVYVRLASMGPQLVRCGMNLPSIIYDCFNGSFNGAATCSLRNVTGGTDGADATGWASMGPQLVRCGMQCSKNHVNSWDIASMGPQLVRCGMLAPSPAPSPSYRCFNGAATCSLRNVAVQALPSV